MKTWLKLAARRAQGPAVLIALIALLIAAIALLVVFGTQSFDTAAAAIAKKTPFFGIFIAVISVAALLFLLIFLAIVLSTYKLSDHPYALGLPKGSVRAILALSLVVIFITTAIFLVEVADLDPTGVTTRNMSVQNEKELGSLREALEPNHAVLAQSVDLETKRIEVKIVSPGSGTARVDLAKQIFTTIATVLVTVVGFYFGTRSAAPDAEKDAAKLVLDSEQKGFVAKAKAMEESATEFVKEADTAVTATKAAEGNIQQLIGEAPEKRGEKAKAILEAALDETRKASEEANAAAGSARERLEHIARERAALEAAKAGEVDAGRTLAAIADAVKEIKLQRDVAEDAAERAAEAVADASVAPAG